MASSTIRDADGNHSTATLVSGQAGARNEALMAPSAFLSMHRAPNQSTNGVARQVCDCVDANLGGLFNCWAGAHTRGESAAAREQATPTSRYAHSALGGRDGGTTLVASQWPMRSKEGDTSVRSGFRCTRRYI